MRLTPSISRFPDDQWFKTGVVSGGDPNFASVSLLLHMDGTDASTTFTDHSNNAFTPTVIGHTQIDTAQSKWGGASGLFDGASDRLDYTDDNDFDLPGDFTIEWWQRWQFLNNYQTPFNNGWTGSDGLLMQSGNGDGKYLVYAGGSIVITETVAASVDTWYHYALTRSGTSMKLFRGGTQVGSTATDSTDFTNTDKFEVGGPSNSTTAGVRGWIDDFRVTKGVARYTSNFSVPTEAFPND